VENAFQETSSHEITRERGSEREIGTERGREKEKE
jgi:hypothetical protein